MSDIHQEWRELRQKNGDFICHLDGEMAKLEKKQVELKHREQLQNLADAGAFAMQFAIPFNCCQDDCDILKALNKAQADRIETLEKEIIARKEQAQIDLAVKKDLDAEEYHKQEDKEAKDIQIGDEVEMFFGESYPDNPHSVFGIVVKVDSERHTFIIIGPNFEGCFDETDIQSGNVRKTGHHFDPIPLDYFK